MLRAAILALSGLTLASCAGGPDPRNEYGRYLKPVANPGKLVATEIAFSRAWHDKGGASALTEFAKPDAAVFQAEITDTPGQAIVQNALPPTASWQTRRVILSCDGAMAAALGETVTDQNIPATYTNIWERQTDGSYRLAISMINPEDSWQDGTDFVTSKIAECSGASNAERDAAYADIMDPVILVAADLGVTLFQDGAKDGSFRYFVARNNGRNHALGFSYFDGKFWQNYTGQYHEESEAEVREELGLIPRLTVGTAQPPSEDSPE